MNHRRIFAALAVLCAVAAPAQAQKTKAALTTEINKNWPDNSLGTITPALLRSTVLDIVNSYVDANGGSSLSCAAHQWIAAIATLSSITCAQPAFTDISGQAGLTQLPTIGANTVLGSVAGGTPIALSQAQITAIINLATASLSGALPAWPNNTTTFFRGDGTYATLNFAAIGGQAALTQLPTIGANTALGSVAGGTPIALTAAQITAMINTATASLSGAIPAWPNNTTTFFRGDGTYPTLNFAAIGGTAAPGQLPLATNAAIGGMRGDTATISCVAGVCSAVGAAATAITELTTTVTGGANGSVLTATTSGCSGTTPCLSHSNVASLLTQGPGIAITGTTNATVGLALNSAVLQAAPGNPTGTSSATQIMMGLGTTCHLTPTYSSRIRIEFNGDVSNAVINASSGLQARFGTGTAPSNGAAASGTTVGPQVNSFTAGAAGANNSFAVGGIITGLTPGTAYWFDLGLLAVTNGPSAVISLGCNAFEVL